jgi:hypothetical protein
VRFAARLRCVSLRGSVGRIGLPDRIVPGRGGDASSRPLGASRTRFTAAGARFSAGRQPSSPADRVTAKVDSLGRATLVRFRVSASLQRSPVAPCRPGVAVSPDHPAAAFVALPVPFRFALAPVRFSTPRVSRSFRSRGRRRRCGSFAAGFVHGGVPGPRAVLATWAGRYWRPADARGVRLTLRSVAPGGAVGGAFRASPGPPAVCSRSAAASGLARGRATSRRAVSGVGCAAPGRSSRGQAVPCGPPAPL